MRGGQEQGAQVSCLSRRREASREMKSVLQTTGQGSFFLTGVSANCVGVMLRRPVCELNGCFFLMMIQRAHACVD